MHVEASLQLWGPNLFISIPAFLRVSLILHASVSYVTGIYEDWIMINNVVCCRLSGAVLIIYS